MVEQPVHVVRCEVVAEDPDDEVEAAGVETRDGNNVGSVACINVIGYKSCLQAEGE